MKRLDQALAEADQAFWHSIVESYPEADNGDLSPLMTKAWEDMQKEVVGEWVGNNVPAPKELTEVEYQCVEMVTLEHDIIRDGCDSLCIVINTLDGAHTILLLSDNPIPIHVR